jgi:hypothetical protein
MGGGLAALFQCRVDEATHGTDATGDRAGDLRGDRVTDGIGVGAVETALWFPSTGGRGLFASTAAAASTPWSNSGKTCAIYTI